MSHFSFELICFKEDFLYEPSIMPEPYQHLSKVVPFPLLPPARTRDVRK